MSDFYNGRGQEVGSLRGVFPALRDGKKIATWEFSPSGARGGKNVAVEIYLVGQEALRFVARCKALPSVIEDSDIESLRKKVQAALLEQSSALTGIAWEDWLEVIVAGQDGQLLKHAGLGASLKLQINPLKRGVDPATGRVLTIDAHGRAMDFPKPSKLGGREAAEGAWGAQASRLAGDGIPQVWLTDPTPERAYVPDTPEVRAALQDILQRMSALRERLATVLSHESIHAALQAQILPQLAQDLGVVRSATPAQDA